ncbi:caspase family protein, partial [bacterium]|nr:caspase family protein [bacterium]
MKHFISVLAIVFALASFGAENHKVYVHYGADAANTTNMMLQVTDGANFAFRGVLPAGYGISSFDYAGIPKQVSNHKSKLLFVGINDYLPSRGLNSLSSCLNDAETLANLLLEGGYFKGEDGVLLENANALTSVIRNQVRAAANQLVSGDLFVYYQSSHGGNSPYS